MYVGEVLYSTTAILKASNKAFCFKVFHILHVNYTDSIPVVNIYGC
jgi:hypothetical protein